MTNDKYAGALQRLLGIMNDLREKCPWDRKQTLDSLRHLTIEETYELSDAVLEGDLDAVKKELGDLLLHIVFYSKIASEQNAFDIADVMNAVCDKVVRRHPHIYGDVKVENVAEVKRNWERIKLQEKDGNKGVLAGVPASLPALIKAMRIQEKVHGVGFDWADKEGVWDKVEEEIAEFKQASAAGDTAAAQGEFGDVLFSLVNYARFTGINPETALERTCRKFIKRFQHMEEAAGRDRKKLQDMSLAEMDAYWEAAKNE